MDTKQQLVNALAGLGSTITEAMEDRKSVV